MPELPEVETIVRDLRAHHLVGKSIKGATVFWHRTVSTPGLDDFLEQLIDQQILDINRRGKIIVFTLSTQTLLVHLRMTGKFILADKVIEPTAHERVRLFLNDGRLLRYEDQRKFGKWYLLPHPEAKLNELGIEPLSDDFSLAAFKTVLKRSSQQIKAFLLNQKYVVGLGNIYVDEALWEAQIHPTRLVDSLSPEDTKALYHAIPLVLKRGVEYMGTTLGKLPSNYFSVSGRRGDNQSQLKVFRRDGQPCPRCQTTIVKMRVAQRGTHVCPKCQK